MKPLLSILLLLGVALPLAAQQSDGDDKPSPVPSRGRRAARLVAIPDYQVGNTESGEAVYFGRTSRKAASGEALDSDELLAAHPLYPFGSVLRVTNTANHTTIEVRVVDRISINSNKVISVSQSAAEQLGFVKMGSAQVKVQLVALGSGR